MLFSNDDVAKLMNERFVPHWVKVRDVPQVTIDFGDGRVLKRTLNGNIATYVCLPDGRTLDVITGLNDRPTYLRRLRQALELFDALSVNAELKAPLVRYHRAALKGGHAAGMRALGASNTPSPTRANPGVRVAPGALRPLRLDAVSKMRVEGPLKRAMKLEPLALNARLPTPRLPSGRALSKGAFSKGVVESGLERELTAPLRDLGHGAVSKGVVESPLKWALDPVQGSPVDLSAAAPDLGRGGAHAPSALGSSAPANPAPANSVPPLEPQGAETKRVVEYPLKREVLLKRAGAKPDLVARAKETLTLDSTINQTKRQRQVHRLLLARALQTPEQLASAVYKEIMHVDIEDPFLGLAPMVLGGEGGRSTK